MTAPFVPRLVLFTGASGMSSHQHCATSNTRHCFGGCMSCEICHVPKVSAHKEQEGFVFFVSRGFIVPSVCDHLVFCCLDG